MINDTNQTTNIISLSSVNTISSQNESNIIASNFRPNTRNNHSDHVICGYTFQINNIQFWLFVGFEYENPREDRKHRGYYCELQNQTNNTDITEIPEIQFIFNKYKKCKWIPTKGKKYKYVFFGREDTNKTDALHLMKNILIDLNAPKDILNTIECK